MPALFNIMAQSIVSNHRVKFVRVAHPTASELRSFASLYAERYAL